MKQKPIHILILTLLFGVVGFILRLGMQEYMYFEHLPKAVLIIVCALFLVLLILLVLPITRRKRLTSIFSDGLFGNAFYMIGGLFVIGGSCTLVPQMSAAATRIDSALSVLEVLLGIAAGVCLIVFAVLRLRQKSVSPAFLMVVTVYLIALLILRFKSWNADPDINSYCYNLLSMITGMLASYYLTGFCFERGHRRTALYFSAAAVFFCFITLADTFMNGTIFEIAFSVFLFLYMMVSLCKLIFCARSSLGLYELDEK